MQTYKHARTHSPGSGSIVLPITARARVRAYCFDPPTVIRVTIRKFQDYNISLIRSIPHTFRQQANLSPSGRGTRRRRRRLRVSRVSGYYKGKFITGGKQHTQCTWHARTHSPGSGSIVLPTIARARVCELCFDPPTVIRVTSTKFQDYNNY